MAGHSKWAQIKRSKGVNDAKRSQLFGKLSRAITIAARSGTVPETNFQLRLAIDRARNANMPKDNIDRAIERSLGADASTIQDILLEAYGPHGSAFLIKASTDNKNRTVGEVRSALNKYSGKLGEGGSVQFLFDLRGVLVFDRVDDNLELSAIDAGAKDVQTHDDQTYVITAPDLLDAARKAMEKDGYNAKELSLEYIAKNTIQLSESDVDSVMKLLEVLEDLDDVETVYVNVELNEQ